MLDFLKGMRHPSQHITTYAHPNKATLRAFPPIPEGIEDDYEDAMGDDASDDGPRIHVH